MPNVELIGLQRGPTYEEWLAKGTPRVAGNDRWCEDVASTAALIKTLDLVISVDTMVAHLAGALGVPVWTLLPFAADWRWMLGRDDTPWYPTMRLFRQAVRGDWHAPMERFAIELAQVARGTTPRRRASNIITARSGGT